MGISTEWMGKSAAWASQLNERVRVQQGHLNWMNGRAAEVSVDILLVPSQSGKAGFLLKCMPRVMMMVRMQHGHFNWMNRRAAGAGWRLLESVECTLSSTLLCDSSNKHLKNDELSKFITKDRIIMQNMQGDTTTLGDSWKSVWGEKMCVCVCVYT